MLLVLDFDGTVAVQDTLDMIVRRWAPGVYEQAEEQLESGAWRLNDVIAYEFEHVEAGEGELVSFLRNEATIRPGLPDLIDFCRERFVEPVVVSSGFHELIEPLLRDAGLPLPVLANHATFTPEGAAVRFRERPLCVTCGERCKRGAVAELADGRAVGYVGDGWSDRCGALGADLVFARAGLARYLDGEGRPYVPFETFDDVRAGLAAYLDAT